MGRTLTFYKSTDTISVDGNDQNRTETQSQAMRASVVALSRR